MQTGRKKSKRVDVLELRLILRCWEPCNNSQRERERERREKLNLESKHAVHSFLIYNAEEKAPVSQQEQQQQQNIPISSAHIPASVKVCSEPTSNPVRTYRQKTLVRTRVFFSCLYSMYGKNQCLSSSSHTDTQ